MRTGIYLDVRNPTGWRRDPASRYAAALDLAVGAEDDGIGAVWISEHHFTDDDYMPQPLVFASAVAARTSSVRIGTAVVTAPFRDPVHLAEEAAVVDLVSGGRLELGLGAGYEPGEFDRFGQELRRRYERTDHAAAEIRRLYGEAEVSPLPVQDPLPIWLGYAGPKGAARAGRLGEGLLSLRRDLAGPYLSALEENGHDTADARMGGVVWMLIGDDPERQQAEAASYVEHQRRSYSAMAGKGSGSAPTTRTMEGVEPGFRSNEVIAFTPEEAVARIRKATEGLPVTDVYFWADYCGMPDELVAEHVAGVAKVASGLV